MEVKYSLLVLALALPASAQAFVSADQAGGVDAALASARSSREKFLPADVDPKPVRLLVDRLAKDGEPVSSQQSNGNIYMRVGEPDARGCWTSLLANLVEVPDPILTPNDGSVRPTVLRRYLSHLEVTSENWEVNPKTGRGTIHVWLYHIALEGKLLSVVQRTAPVEPGADGRASPVEAKARTESMSPSDPDVQSRWKALTKELLTLGRILEA